MRNVANGTRPCNGFLNAGLLLYVGAASYRRARLAGDIIYRPPSSGAVARFPQPTFEARGSADASPLYRAFYRCLPFGTDAAAHIGVLSGQPSTWKELSGHHCERKELAVGARDGMHKEELGTAGQVGSRDPSCSLLFGTFDSTRVFHACD